MSSLAALTALECAATAGFRHDARFVAPCSHQAPPPSAAPAPEADPVALAWAEGYARGREDAQAEAALANESDRQARAELDLALRRLDADLAEDLRRRLQDAVLSLCEATLVPFALDPDALAVRVERAVGMLARADDERVIRLHPDDLPLVAASFKSDWRVVADPGLERGALRVETQSGGVEDGPAQWRHALAEALHAC